MANCATNLIVYIAGRHPTISPTTNSTIANFPTSRASPLEIEISFCHIFSISKIQ